MQLFIRRSPYTPPGWWLAPVPLSISYNRTRKINALGFKEEVLPGWQWSWLAGFPLRRPVGLLQRMAATVWVRSLGTQCSQEYSWPLDDNIPGIALPPPCICLVFHQSPVASILFLSQSSTSKSPAQSGPGGFYLQTHERKSRAADPRQTFIPQTHAL